MRVPLGDHALSVSILMFRFTEGEENFLRDSFNVSPATHDQKVFILTLVLAVTSHIFWTFVLSANVTISSKNTIFPAVTSSPAMYSFEVVEIAVAAVIAPST